jgi:maltooligosyltrehalose trehalohydrolase
VVYNHFGPDGAYHGTFSPYYYSTKHTSPWGQGINYDGPHSDGVRRFVIENALHWIHEYHFDGLRLDATHAIIDESEIHIVAEIAAAVRQTAPGALVIAEDHRNHVSMLRPVSEGGWQLQGVWSDDFHHQMRRALAGDSDGYFGDFDGTAAGIAETARRGWFYRGQYSSYFDEPRGSDPAGESLSRFVFFIQNHDQVGNRAYGDRLNHAVDAATYRAAGVLHLCLPETPLLFMGQEWAASSPFRYFTDHHRELGLAVTKGRREEFRRFARFADPESAAGIPDPQDPATFASSRLSWHEAKLEPHAGIRRLYQRMLELRRAEPSLRRPLSSGDDFVSVVDEGVLLVRRSAPGRRTLLIVARLRGSGAVNPGGGLLAGHSWLPLLSTEDGAFTNDPRPIASDPASGVLNFARPGAIVLAGGTTGA